MLPFDEYKHDYALCQDSVTVYHYDGISVTRTVYPKAFLDSKKNQNIERTGSEETNGFLLVIPGSFQACAVGDKAIVGEGPQVPEQVGPVGATGGQPDPRGEVAKWWRAFIPSKVDGLVVVKHVDVKRFGGKIVHTEAGG